MNTDAIVKGTLLAMGMAGISGGMTMIGAKDLYGFVLVVTGFVIIYLREKLKVS